MRSRHHLQNKQLKPDAQDSRKKSSYFAGGDAFPRIGFVERIMSIHASTPLLDMWRPTLSSDECFLRTYVLSRKCFLLLVELVSCWLAKPSLCEGPTVKSPYCKSVSNREGY